MREVCAHGNLKRQCETCAAWESAVHNQRRAEKAEARVKELERERDEARAAIAGILTPQLRAILTEDPCVPGAVTGGHDRDDIVIVGRIGFGRLKRALDALTGGT